MALLLAFVFLAMRGRNMIPSARPTPKVISASTASQIERAGTGPLNDGLST